MTPERMENDLMFVVLNFGGQRDTRTHEGRGRRKFSTIGGFLSKDTERGAQATDKR